MNKRKLFIIAFLFFAVLSIANICYGKSYSIDEIDMQATILENGDVNVKQTMTYTFRGKYNGVYVTIPYELDDDEYNAYRQQGELKDSLYNNSGVTINSVSCNEEEFNKVASAENGAQKLYTLEENDGIMKVKFYMPSNNQTRTFKIDYTLENVCVKHNDVGELYYNFIGGEWEEKIKKLNIDVYLDDKNASLKIWGHGNYNGVSKILSNNHANFKTSDVRSGEYVAVRMMFSLDVIKNTTKTSGIEATDLILKDENVIGENLEAKKKRIQNTGKFCIILLAYWLILLSVYEIDKKYKTENFDENELFKKYNPLIAGCIQGSREVLARDIIAVVLNLIDKKIINLELVPVLSTLKGKNGGYIYKISKCPEKEKEMDKIERYIYTWIFKKEYTVDLARRLKKLPEDNDASMRFKNIDVLAKEKLNSLGANQHAVPMHIRFLNNVLLIMTLVWGRVSIQQLIFNIFNSQANRAIALNFIIYAILFLPIIMVLVYIPLQLIINLRRKMLNVIQKYSGKKLVSTVVTILSLSILVMLITGQFTSARGLILDEILITIALIICLTDNLMLKNSAIIIEDFSKLNALKDRIKDYTFTEERDIEYVFLWNKYLAYAVSFGVANLIMKKIKNMTNDDDLQIMFANGINFFIDNDYDYFYRRASLEERFLENYNEVTSNIFEKMLSGSSSNSDSDSYSSSSSSSGHGRRIFWRRRIQWWRRPRPEDGGAF